jgi:hypothetical protein
MNKKCYTGWFGGEEYNGNAKREETGFDRKV